MKAVIIEDEMLNANQLENKIHALADDIEVIAKLPSLKTARKWMTDNPEPDVYFMDIQLGDGTSFELFESFTIGCPVVFVTAFDEYALRAFKVNGVDYILKPVEDSDLEKAIEKVRKIWVAEQQPAALDIQSVLKTLTGMQAGPVYKQTFLVQQRKNLVPVPVEDVAVIMHNNLNYLVLMDDTKHILNTSTLDELEEVLDPAKFFRANRQAIIHFNAIQSVKPLDNAKLTVYMKPPLKMEFDISRDKAPMFKKWLDR
jgi:DNA-binding LytR/AlgR family response regulator